MSDKQPSVVSTADEFADLIAEAKRSDRLALDTEFMRERTYRARLCLVQLATREGLYLIDPLAEIDLQPVAELVGDPDTEVIVHAGSQDLAILHERYGISPRKIYDVQVAAGFVGLGASLPYGRLVELTLGVRLEKGESYTDWCRRPLSDAQLRYAADDVRYLHQIADHIDAKLHALGRINWVREEMELLEDPALYESDPSKVWRRVTGRGSLSGRQMAVLRELAAWRENEAARRDLPRGWVIKDPTLVEIARRGPTSVGALKPLRGMNAKEADRSGREIIEAVRRGKDAPAVDLGPPPPKGVQARARMLSGLADAIVRSRCEKAEVATELVATRGELETLLAEVVAGDLHESRHRLLQGWRGELAGEAVIALAEGRIAVKAVPRPPYIEEVPL